MCPVLRLIGIRGEKLEVHVNDSSISDKIREKKKLELINTAHLEYRNFLNI